MLLIWHYLPLTSTIMGLAYSLFISALVVATVTDFYSLTIPQLASIWLAPVGIAVAASGNLQISVWQSVVGAIIGYTSLWIINFAFKKMRNIDGIGVGDMELLCMIGAFIGPIGLYYTVLIASVTGSAWGLTIRLVRKQAPTTPIPFGPFLALGGMLYLLLTPQLSSWFMLG
jgi:leader peptidase (prepilin peptidase)/N-methyltransferase